MAAPIEIFQTKVTTAVDALALINGVFQWAFGPSEPSITFPFLNWADTGNDLWKQRNADDNGWIIRGKLSALFFGLTPVDDNNSPLVSNGNYIINPRFEIAQRGTSFTTVGYTLDRWASHSLGGGAATISQQSFTIGQTAVPDNPKKYLRWNQTGAASTEPELQQRIECVETLAGQTCTVIFWAKANTEQTFKIGFRQRFGTGGSPSVDVDGAVQQVQLTTNWQKYTLTFALPSVTGKSLGTNGNDYLALRLVMPAGVTFTIDIANLIVAKGQNVNTCCWRSIGQELTLCQRFYETGYLFIQAQTNAAGQYVGIGYSFAVKKRATPSMSFISGPGEIGITDLGNVSRNGGGFRNGKSTEAGVVVIDQYWEADAEL